MKLGIMQPYFFPYPGYFALIHEVDRWVVFDTPQYIRHGWVNRNRVLHPSSGWQYILAPLRKHPRETPIRDVELAAPEALADRVTAQLEHYRKHAPFFERTIALVRECLEAPPNTLSRLNVRILETICRHLGIAFRGEPFSEMELDLGRIDGPGEWALEIADALGASSYVNPPGGRAIFDPARFAARGIRLEFQQPSPLRYDCPPYGFEADLSIVDALMWNEPAAVLAHFECSRELPCPR